MQPTTDRLIHLDVLRGFALLGILLVNFELFTRPVLASFIGLDAGLEGMDRAVDMAILWLAEGKFYPLFAMLFGIGFALMLERARETGSSFWPIYLRRTIVLALFGLAHIALVWVGDILLLYSLAALIVVLLFRNTPLQRQWKWGLFLIAIPMLLMWLYAAFFAAAQADPEAAEQFRAGIEADREQILVLIEEAEDVHTQGSYAENVVHRVHEYGGLAMHFGFQWIPMVLGFFMLGRWLIQSGRLRDISRHESWLRRWRLWGLGIGLPLSAVSTWMIYDADWLVPTPDVALGTTLLIVAGVILPLGYLATVVLASRRLAFLAPAGRMALSNYLLQSIVWTLVFYGYGLDLWQEIDRLWHPLLVVGFFALQVAASYWWLKQFRFGPAEWLWRSITYLQWQPFRRTANA